MRGKNVAKNTSTAATERDVAVELRHHSERQDIATQFVSQSLDLTMIGYDYGYICHFAYESHIKCEFLDLSRMHNNSLM